MTIRTILAFITAASGAVATQTPAAAAQTQSPAAEQQCRWESPAQYGPRAPVRAAVWTCAPPARAHKVCGRYELYWPHWLSQRALPPVRRWVADSC